MKVKEIMTEWTLTKKFIILNDSIFNKTQNIITKKYEKRGCFARMLNILKKQWKINKL